MMRADSTQAPGGTLAQLVRAEQVKLRRSFAGQLWWIGAILGALCSWGLTFAVPESAKTNDTDPALEFVSLTLRIWASLFVPIIAILRCAAAGQVEFASRGLKHLFALPVSRTRLFMAKAASAGLSLTAASLLFFALTVAAGIQANLLPLDAAHGAWVQGTARAGGILVATLMLAALHVAISSNMSSYSAVVSLGIVLLVASMFTAQLLGRFAPYYPWALASNLAIVPFQVAQPLLVWACAVIVMSMAIGAQILRRRLAS